MIKMSKKTTLKNVVKGLFVILLYFMMSILQTLPFDLFNIDLAEIPIFLKSIYLLFYEILMIAIMLLVYKDLVCEKWKDFKKNHKEYFKKYFKFWYLILGLMMISNLIIMIVTQNTEGAENQAQILELFGKAPIYTYISAVVFAPIVEELVFRQSIRNLIPKWNWLFIFVSGFIFGGMHVLGATTLAEFIYIIPYSIPGLIFAYILTKTDNIFSTIGLHFVHNGILMSLQTILLIFG